MTALVLMLAITAVSPVRAGTPARGAAVSPAEEQHARSWIRVHGAAAESIASSVSIVPLAMRVVRQSSTQANVNQLGSVAQTAQEGIENIRADFTSPDSGSLGNAERDIALAIRDFKAAMEAAIAYTDNPSREALELVSTGYEHAAAEWNRGIRTIWRLGHQSTPPTV